MNLGREIVRLSSVGSTMDVLDSRARAGADEGLVVVADEQTSGRGRSGRIWMAPPGSSLLCSILLRPSVAPERVSSLPLIVGIAVAETIESFVRVPCALKWPNDVLLDGRKIAGILLQSRVGAAGVEFVNVGVGINVSTMPSELPDGAVSIRSAGGCADRDAALARLIERLAAHYAAYCDAAGRPDLSSWRERAAMTGERISVARGGEIVQGMFEGIEDDGRLRLRRDDGDVLVLDSGDVERGPRPETPLV